MFKVYESDVLVGTSELENEDNSMSIRAGRFYPTAAYKRIQPAIAELSMILAIRDVDPFAPREIELKKTVGNLEFLITTESDEVIGTQHVDIADYSDELGEEGIEVTMMAEDRGTYERFFGDRNDGGD